MIPKQSRVIFIRTASRMLDTYTPEVRTSTDAVDIDDIFQALCGFFMSCGWNTETTESAILSMAEKIKENDRKLELCESCGKALRKFEAEEIKELDEKD